MEAFLSELFWGQIVVCKWGGGGGGWAVCFGRYYERFILKLCYMSTTMLYVYNSLRLFLLIFFHNHLLFKDHT